MIRSLHLRGFKRFRDQSFAFEPLTILAGLNGSGKTSLIHALLLAREASVATSGRTVRLNGPYGLELGSAADVRNWESDDLVRIEVEDDDSVRSQWQLAAPSDEALYLVAEEVPATPPFAFTAGARVFNYLCAERLGPRSVLPAAALPAEALEVGVRGEHCAQLLSVLGDRPAHEARVHPKREPEAAALLKYEVERWLRDIARPVEITAEPYRGTAITTLRFRTPGGEWVRAPNMGFGVSYSLPVVLAGLAAAPGGVLVVENPEAHLHPSGQSWMGVFLAWLAGCGVQVIAETHSDHVLNGVRRAIGEHHYLGSEAAVVHFFDSEVRQTGELRFTSTGGVSDWPAGFFDQYQIDVAALGRVRRAR